MKQDIFSNQNVPSLEVQNEFKGSRHKTLIKQTEYWQDIIKSILPDHVSMLSNAQGKQWYISMKNATWNINRIIHNLQRV